MTKSAGLSMIYLIILSSTAGLPCQDVSCEAVHAGIDEFAPSKTSATLVSAHHHLALVSKGGPPSRR